MTSSITDHQPEARLSLITTYEECEDLSVAFWAMLTGKDIMIQ